MKDAHTAVLFGVALSLSLSCTPGPTDFDDPDPNILWIVLEDTAPLLGAYGTTIIATPNIDRLAEAGVRYHERVHAGARLLGQPVQHHHGHDVHDARAAQPPQLADGGRPRSTCRTDSRPSPNSSRKPGTFPSTTARTTTTSTTTVATSTTRTTRSTRSTERRGDRIELAGLKDRQPFFGQIQLPGGKEIFSSAFEESVETPVDRAAIELPPYLPDHPAIVEEYANHLDAIQITDRKVGQIMDELRENGLLENTIVFFFSDHGMRMTRNKQFLYDGGLHVPLIIADFREHGVHSTPERRTTRSSAGSTSGQARLRSPAFRFRTTWKASTSSPRISTVATYVISTRDRCDFTIDRIRSVRSKRFKYIRNFLTDRPYAQPTYMDVDGVEFVRVMRQLYAENKSERRSVAFLFGRTTGGGIVRP